MGAIASGGVRVPNQGLLQLPHPRGYQVGCGARARGTGTARAQLRWRPPGARSAGPHVASSRKVSPACRAASSLLPSF